MGLSVPGDLSIIAWDDSPICRLVHPPLTALTRDISAYGTHAARLLLAAIDGKPVTDVHDEPAHLSPRGSTAPPPATTPRTPTRPTSMRPAGGYAGGGPVLSRTTSAAV